ncbi:D-alanyl-D-alanine carboxypeptidase family protein [Sinimarinibacterium sp. CAU 1509]|uniref:M15 family metallopeptidase n=1 Tax=Sinimarinibacterium sp. CAU 1509 TaxID=2562283 RepID=UPI0010AD844A|nr:M15 family metallopeptidase [Sinimarinibacterium sp. CAU 1509]TJY58818.1 D-alanyl-D-alanine carboxypeptidase family protein [Sinimarinibacterium sp. CAU 1509]
MTPTKSADTLLHALGIDAAQIAQRGLRRFDEARRLAPAGVGPDGRDKFLTPATLAAWNAMHRAAHAAGIELLLISGFRSYAFQAALIRAKLDRGMSLDQALGVNAPPGYSEHHSGRAIDIGVHGCAALDEAFELTSAFRWLQQYAGTFGFRLTYPRNNPEGFVYEPWHWCFHRHR